MFLRRWQLILLRLRSGKGGIQDSQRRIERCVGDTYDFVITFSTGHTVQLKTLSTRFGTSQARIESQQTPIESKIQAILTSQQKSKNSPITSRSLDASSPEGRQTWKLGTMSKSESITSAIIQKNGGLLVNAMKETFKDKNVSAESISESYVTDGIQPLLQGITRVEISTKNKERDFGYSDSENSDSQDSDSQDGNSQDDEPEDL